MAVSLYVGMVGKQDGGYNGNYNSDNLATSGFCTLIVTYMYTVPVVFEHCPGLQDCKSLLPESIAKVPVYTHVWYHCKLKTMQFF